MTRRPLQPRLSRLQRTTHAQTPSARKASESPTAQLGPTRPPRQAATEPVPSEAWWTDMYQPFWTVPGEWPPKLYDVDYSSSWSNDLPDPIGAGVLGIYIATGIDIGFERPNSSWTTIQQGTYERLGYWAGYTRITDPAQLDPTNWEVPITGLSPGWQWGTSPDASHMPFGMTYLVSGGDYWNSPDPNLTATTATPVVSAVTTYTGHELALPQPPSSMFNACQFMHHMPVDPYYWTASYDNITAWPPTPPQWHWNTYQYDPFPDPVKTGIQSSSGLYFNTDVNPITPLEGTQSLWTMKTKAGWPYQEQDQPVDAYWVSFCLGFQ